MISSHSRAVLTSLSLTTFSTIIFFALCTLIARDAQADPDGWQLLEDHIFDLETQWNYPGRYPERYACDLRGLRDNIGDLAYGPAIDCDDKAYLFCLQFPANDCWQLGIFRIGENRDIGHEIAITRRLIGPNLYEYCLVEPVPVHTNEPNPAMWCWQSPYPNPSEGFPSDDIRRALCEHGPEWWWDGHRPNCNQLLPIDPRPVIELPTPGHEFDPVACGEPRWDRCGSFSEICRVLNFCDNRGIECLPLAERSCLRSCDAMLDGPGELCLAGEVTLCRNNDGKIQPLYCCAMNRSSWCLAPIGPQADCRMFLGQSCQRVPSAPHFVDCRIYTPGPVYGQLPGLQTLECGPCPGSTPDTQYCWRTMGSKFNGKSSSLSLESMFQ